MVINVLELYSGIGGMHFALAESGIQFHVVAAIDINPVCNAVYNYNFPETHLIAKCLTSISVEDFNNMSADMIVMSPPCQPFTIIGNQKDIHDERTKSFQYLLSMLPKFHKLPSYILMENVKGMTDSIMRNEFIDVLNQLNYKYQEFVLDPSQFNIPNSRRRYYLLAKLQPNDFSFQTKSEIMHTLPTTFSVDPNNLISIPTNGLQNDSYSSNNYINDINTELQPLCNFLEKQPFQYFKNFLLPKKLYKKFWLMDLVSEKSKSCCCFTKGYGRYIEKSGSIFQTYESKLDLFPYKNNEDDEKFVMEIEKLGLRFFTPREVANLMCFPSTFKFPEHLNVQQKYRVLGNSINVHVVSQIIKILCA